MGNYHGQGGCRRLAHHVVTTIVIGLAVLFLFAGPILQGCAQTVNFIGHLVHPSDEGQPGSRWL